jgi:RNA polymerase sigma-70 factor (ECF subfamily)
VLGAEFPEVLSRVRAGDERAFATVWRSYQPSLLRYLTVLIGDAADDVASETWIAVVRNMSRFDGDEKGFFTWLLTIGRHRAVDWGRQRRNRTVVLQEEDQLDAVAPAAPDPAALVIDQITAREAVAMIGRTLPPQQAEAVILRSVVGLDVTEVARIMGKRTGAVRVLAHRGLRRLAEVMGRRKQELG